MKDLSQKKYPYLLGFGFLIPLLGYLSSLGFDAKETYLQLSLPAFAPNALVFPIVWTILYIFLGVYLGMTVYECKWNITVHFVIQFIVNLSWGYVFFNYQLYVIALIIITLLLMLVYNLFIKTKCAYTYFLIPYLFWLVFAFFLNFNIILYN